MTIASDINEFVQPVDDWINNYPDVYIWYVAFVFILIAGLLFLWKFRAMQIATLPEQVKLLKPTPSEGKIGETKKGMISSFQAFCVGMGARVGVGNITGVTSAILLGGAGAVFWMWIFAIIGAGTSFVECTLGQLFKEKKSDGNFHGGPAYYIKNGLKNHKFAIFIAFWIIVTYGIGFIANQAANSASAFTEMEALADFEWISIVMGVIFAALAGFLIFGGIRRVAKASEILVPVMVVIWLLIGIVAILLNLDNFGWAVGEIFTGAFDFEEIFAGFAGSCIMWGLKRGVFSNEAGIGSVPNVASSAHVEHPVRQGLIQSVGVLIDTLVVCSITAFMVLCSLGEGVGLFGKGQQMAAVQASMSNAFGGDWILWVLAIFMFVFAFSSLISYYSMSEANLRFIKDDEGTVKILRVVIVAVVFLACIVPVGLVWDLMDVFMAVMGIFNIIALLMLFKYVVSVYKDYREQKAAGIEEPVFDVSKWDSDGLDKSGISVWNRE